MVDRRLGQRIVEVLCEEWEKARPGILESETIHDRLADEGVEAPDWALDEVLDRLKSGGLIKAATLLDSEARRRHGARTISWVHTDLLC